MLPSLSLLSLKPRWRVHQQEVAALLGSLAEAPSFPHDDIEAWLVTAREDGKPPLSDVKKGMEFVCIKHNHIIDHQGMANSLIWPFQNLAIPVDRRGPAGANTFQTTKTMQWDRIGIVKGALERAVALARQYVATESEYRETFGDDVYHLCFFLYSQNAKTDVTPRVINVISKNKYEVPDVSPLVPAMVHALITSPDKIEEALKDADEWPDTTITSYVSTLEKIEGEAYDGEEALLVHKLIRKMHKKPEFLTRLSKLEENMNKQFIENVKKKPRWS